ncbi:SDR family oxidoreductase [Rhizobium hidalgonense]|uniref:Nucleoside-diphosphate sugar epimerase n=1 Tax=Rhizobium hidalgonense TaxID=1538159 RepID=A0A2A6K827_9HYPH|nr:SDR family oxidoreductase [Rhizobium hidalgonense]MDR9775962.1 SDR family oxidoreductase [Rhizobium hidalgonense]MDR9815101.1 SDR family oxidoreductase [Rhizobium hidalgonense]MDR9820771.1 SDR family oxidoreductase [Rhizobium hidalgonense]PDT21017.1 nucleoside-diphosphate sugar epimerase [Rhizobium hidalgonense]PON07247.1 nucleoside-diphosphate sugar epimerase [Rhizobium hidalgonense]
MKILVIGATGLVGSAVCARLATGGYDVTRAVRPGKRPAADPGAWVEVDVARAVGPADWLRQLEGIDAVVNCSGALQEGMGHRMTGVHARGPRALFRACEQSGVRRMLHFSAIGVDRQQPSAFSRTKLSGDMALMETDLDWVILRPAVILGDAAFGSSALFRGLAALPLLPLMPSTGKLQVVQLEDVAETVLRLVDKAAPSKLSLEIVGPQQLEFHEIVARYRRWLGWPPAKRYLLPRPLASLLYRLGDSAGLLGWRPPVRSTAAREIVRGAVGDPTDWIGATGILPASLDEALARRPVSVQERWFAKLYFLKPVIFVLLPLFWISTGAISLTSGFEEGVELMLAGGAGFLATPSVIAGAFADIVIGCAIAWRRTARLGLFAAVLLSLFYSAAGTAILPELWSAPLGPLTKVWPILVLHLVALAVLEER